MMNGIVNFIKKEIVFCIAFLCALVSCFFVPPSKQYVSYIDWNTLFILFSLMAVVQGLSSSGLFHALGNGLCHRLHSLRALCAALVTLCFFTSMLITNDVALITFVPFALILLGENASPLVVTLVVIMQTIAANTGSMLTPLGNPQNLFLFQQTGMSIKEFFLTLIPYTALSGILLALMLFFIPGKGMVSPKESSQESHQIKNDIPYLLLFLLCLLSVLHLVPKWITAALVLVVLLVIKPSVLLKVDYMLLLTFAAFFIFTGNISHIPSVSQKLGEIVGGSEFFSAIVSSQIISNVPATLLLYPFSTDSRELLLGVNAGGLGTLIASLASLISFKLYSASPKQKRKSSAVYLLLFTLANVVFLALLILLHAALICKFSQ